MSDTHNQIRLTGTMTCPPDRLSEVRAALPDHIRLTRAEPGCIRFEVTETAEGRFEVDELFVDQAAFEAHQTRGGASPWAEITAGLPRDFKVFQVGEE